MNWFELRRALAGGLVAALTLLSLPGAGHATVEVAGWSGYEKPRQPDPAEAKVSQEEALQRLRNAGLYAPAEHYGDQVNGHLTQGMSGPVWQFDFAGRRSGQRLPQYAMVDATTGQVVSYWASTSPRPVKTGPQSAGPSADEVKAKAEAVLERLVGPAAAHSLQLVTDEGLPWQVPVPGDGGDVYSLRWMRLQNGIPFPDASVYLTLDSDTFEVVNFNANVPTGVTFGSNVPDLSPEKALATWKAASGKLAYQRIYDHYGPYMTGKAGFQLVYQFEAATRPVDAYTGELGGDPMSLWLNQEMRPVPEGTATPVVPAVLPLTDEGALALAATILGVPAGSLQVQFSDPESGYLTVSGDGGYINLSRTTGQVTNAWRGRKGEPAMPVEPPAEPAAEPAGEAVEAPASPDGSAKPEAPARPTAEQVEQARAAAINVVQTYLSPLRPHLRLRPDPMPQYGPGSHVLSFNFVRFVNGIPVLDDSVYVNIDLNTMAWQDFSANWSEGLEFPSPAGIVTPDQAEARFFEGRAPRLVYQGKYDDAWFAERGGTPVRKAGLVYQLWPMSGSAVDARTGEVLDWGGQTPASYTEALQRIAGHWAEGELRFLLGRGLVPPVDLKPEGGITRLMGLRIVQTIGVYGGGYPWRPDYSDLPYTDVEQDSPAYGDVMNAYQQGWLRPADGETEFRPDVPLTRAEFIVWVARTLGLGDLARSELAVRHSFADGDGLTVEQRNAALFLQALGILAKGDQLRGSDPITQAEAAAIIVRVYNKQTTR